MVKSSFLCFACTIASAILSETEGDQLCLHINYTMSGVSLVSSHQLVNLICRRVHLCKHACQWPIFLCELYVMIFKDWCTDSRDVSTLQSTVDMRWHQVAHLGREHSGLKLWGYLQIHVPARAQPWPDTAYCTSTDTYHIYFIIQVLSF